MTSSFTALCAAVLLGLPAMGSHLREGRPPSPPVPRVSVFVFTPAEGDWGVDIENHQVRFMVREAQGTRRFSRQLTEGEEARLATLVTRLPRERKTYSFGKTAADITPDFALSVGLGKDERTYNVGWYLEDADDGPALRSVLEILGFIHPLIESKEAAAPPLDWRSRKE